jgi:hypothetical protein
VSLSHGIIGSTGTFRSVDLISIVIIDVSEFNFLLFIVSWITSEAAWFDKEHNWNQNDNNNQECKSNATLSWNV